jgi:Flp pilus assembly protein CpaB
VAISAQRRRRVLVAVVAALIAAGVFVLALSQLGKAPVASTPPAPTATPGQTRTVVEASVDITQGAAITAADLTTASVAASPLPASTFSSPAQLTGTKMFATTNILASTIITGTMVTANPSAAAFPGTTFSMPRGYVAVALPYSSAAVQGGSSTGTGTGGYIGAGARIDILAFYSSTGTEYVAYQDVLVLDIGQGSGAPAGSPAASASPASSVSSALVMVELPQQDAVVLTSLVAGGTATLQYLIVAPGDYPTAASPGPSPIAGPSPAGTPQSVSSSGQTSSFGG